MLEALKNTLSEPVKIKTDMGKEENQGSPAGGVGCRGSVCSGTCGSACGNQYEVDSEEDE